MCFEFDGKRYGKASSHQKEWGSRIIAELRLKGDERVLDLGCGDGTLTRRLAELVPDGSVMGIDSSRGMIDTARSKEGGNIEFQLMDINHLRLIGKFDLVFSNATLHWIRDHVRLWNNILAVLAENGGVRFSFAGEGNCSAFIAVIREAMSLDAFRGVFADFEWPWYMPSVDEYRGIVAPLPFTSVEVWGENADRIFPDGESMTGWIDQPSIVPFLRHLGEKERRVFRNYVVKSMLERTRNDGGGFLETFRRIHVLAAG